jgi:hypothetical protein
MNPLERSLIEKAGNDNGFEHTLEQNTDTVTLASARHRTRAVVELSLSGYTVRLASYLSALLPELSRSFALRPPEKFLAATDADLAQLLRRAASLSQVLPNQAVLDYEVEMQKELAELPTGLGNTEVERIVRQRLGQERFRTALFDYWGGACAVTGVDLPEVLRASHAKPWAECDSDAERLDVYNGYLLTANLDALFDRFLISFDDAGHLLTSPRLTQKDLEMMSIHPAMHLRWIAEAHRSYLAFHRVRFQQLVNASLSVSTDHGGELSL